MALEHDPAQKARLILHGDRVVASNKQALSLFGCDRQGLLGQSILALSPPSQSNGDSSEEILRRMVMETLAGKTQQFEWQYRRPDGHSFSAQVVLEPISARGKILAQATLVPLLEVDAANRSAEALLKFRLGIERSNDAIFMTGADGTIIYTNPAFEKIYGYSGEEAQGKTPRILKSGILSPEVYHEFWATLLDGQVVAGEIINKRKDGRLLTIEGSNNPILDDEGRLIGFLAIHRDVTERKAAEEALQQARDELEQRVAKRTAELTEANRRLLEQFAELQDVHSALERRNVVLEMLNKLSRQTAAGLELRPIFEQVLETSAQLIDATSAYVSVLDLEEGTSTVVADYCGLEANKIERVSDVGSTRPLDATIGEAAEQFTGLGKTDIAHQDDPEAPPALRDQMERYGVKSMLRLPVAIQGEPVALIEYWDSRQKRDFSEEDIDLVRATVQQVAVSVENARLYEQAMNELDEKEQLEAQIKASAERRRRQVRLSGQIALDIAAATDLTDLYSRVVTQVKEQFGFYHTQLLNYDPAVDAVVLIAGYGEIGEKMLAAGHRMPMGVGLIGRAAVSGRPLLRPDVSTDPDWAPNPLLPHTRGELAVPIALGDEVLGVLDVQSDVAGELDQDDQLALEGMCGQIAVAIESTRLRQEMADRLRELDRLQRIMSREGWQVYRGQKEMQAKGYRFDQSAIRSFTTDQLPAVEEMMKGRPMPVPQDSEAAKVVATPMTVRGAIIGALGIQEDPETPLSEEDHELLDSITIQVAEALESARLLEQTQKHAVEMEAVAQVSAAASTILDADQLLGMVVKLAGERFGLYHVAIFLREDDLLHLAAGTAFPAASTAEASLTLPLSAQQSLVVEAARTGKAVLVNDVEQESLYLAHPVLPETRSELAIPLIVGEQKLGVLDLQSEVIDRFGEDDIRIHTTLAAQVAVALQNALLYAEQLRTAEQLREVDRLKSEFLASMSHELRTPLNSIIGFADVLLEGIDGPLNERMKEDVILIRDSGRHLRELISEMLDMSKIEAGVMELHYESINVTLLAREIMANARSLAMHKSIDLYVNVDPKLDTVIADRTRLTQVLLNLMSNAIKFTEQGTVTLSLEAHRGGLLASVQDTGIGIKEADIPTIFEQFRQIDGSLTRKVGGTGLGIPISKKLVELHGGNMWVDSEPAVGSTFWFTIPAINPADQRTGTGPLNQ